MTSACELKFDDFSICEQKEFVPDSFVFLFQEDDRRTAQLKGDDEDYQTVGYYASRDVVLARLNFGGFTAEASRRAFDVWLKHEKDIHDIARNGTPNPLSDLTYEEWQRRTADVIRTRFDFSKPRHQYKDDLDRLMRDLSEDYLFFAGYGSLLSIRAILEAMPEIQEVCLDISALIHAEYLAEDEAICDLYRQPDARRQSVLQPTVVIGEGGIDISVLKLSLKKLYPELYDFVTFFDYDGSNSDAGASYLVKFLRAFGAARINTAILAIFDNDAAGAEAFDAASRLSLPDTICITRLPDLALARSYPTVGPQGTQVMDVNGQAVSIEFFLGRHNLLDRNGNPLSVHWRSYMPSVELYQGEIEDKRGIYKRFLKDMESDQSRDWYHARFPDLIVLWKHIFSLVSIPSFFTEDVDD